MKRMIYDCGGLPCQHPPHSNGRARWLYEERHVASGSDAMKSATVTEDMYKYSTGMLARLLLASPTPRVDFGQECRGAPLHLSRAVLVLCSHSQKFCYPILVPV